MLKGGDQVLYNIAKAIVNAIYGCMVQKPMKDDIVENYTTTDPLEVYDTVSCINEESYKKYVDSKKKVLLYQYGCYITSYAFRNLFELGECYRLWIYSDTDSVYGVDINKDKLKEYNNKCKEKLLNNNYTPVIKDAREYWLGVAEHDGAYSEFKTLGAKRYCCRDKKSGKLKITVAGVPKKGVECLNNDITNFTDGFIFSGKKTGKLTHFYLYNDITTDKNGNVYADSVDLVPCDYLLSKVVVSSWEDLFMEETEIQVYEEY